MNGTSPEPGRVPAAASEGAYPGWQVALSFGLGWFFVVVGLVGVLYTPVLIWQTQQFVTHAVHAKVPIAEFKTYPPDSRDTHELYRPIVEITDAQGNSVRCLVGAAAYPSPYKVGQLVEVLYPAGNPAEAVLDDTEDTWGTAIAAAIFFSFVLVLGIGVVVWMRYFVEHPPEHLVWLDRWSIPLRILSRLLTT